MFQPFLSSDDEFGATAKKTKEKTYPLSLKKKLKTGCGKLAPQLGVRFGLYGLIKRAMKVEQTDTDS